MKLHRRILALLILLDSSSCLNALDPISGLLTLGATVFGSTTLYQGYHWKQNTAEINKLEQRFDALNLLKVDEAELKQQLGQTTLNLLGAEKECKAMVTEVAGQFQSLKHPICPLVNQIRLFVKEPPATIDKEYNYLKERKLCDLQNSIGLNVSRLRDETKTELEKFNKENPSHPSKKDYLPIRRLLGEIQNYQVVITSMHDDVVFVSAKDTQVRAISSKKNDHIKKATAALFATGLCLGGLYCYKKAIR